MAISKRFPGANRVYEMKPYEEGDKFPAMRPMTAYSNPVASFTRWQLSPEEIEEVIRTGEVWMVCRNGERPMQPHWVGSLGYIKWACSDLGGLWNLPEELNYDEDA
jgi:hypothetical protein